MDFLLLIIFVQILLESLPVSSSGHLILVLNVLLGSNGKHVAFLTCVTPLYYALHGATAFVVLIFFYNFWKNLLRDMWIKRTLFIRSFIFFFIIEFVTLIGFVIFRPFLKNIPVSIGFIVTACFLFGLKKMEKDSGSNKWDYGDALLIGLAQTLAFVPGISRLGITYFIARLRKIPSIDALAISFLAFVPLGMGGLAIGLYQLSLASAICFHNIYWIGILFATIGSYFLLYLIYFLVKRNRLWWLGWYMLLPIIVSLCI